MRYAIAWSTCLWLSLLLVLSACVHPHRTPGHSSSSVRTPDIYLSTVPDPNILSPLDKERMKFCYPDYIYGRDEVPTISKCPQERTPDPKL